MFKYIALTILTIGAAGCASTMKSTSNEYECTGADWADMGFNMAKSGKSVRNFDKYVSSCGNKLEANAKSDYTAGYTQGLIEYCTYANGYALVNLNLKPHEICPLELRSEFNRGYKIARDELSEKKRGLRRLSDNADRSANTSAATENQLKRGER